MDMTKLLNGETNLWKQERVLFFDEHYNVGRPPWQSLRILVRQDLECSSIGIVCCSCTEIVHFDFAKERWATVAADASGRSHYLHRRNSATCGRCKFALCFVVINLHWCIFCFLGRTSIDQLMFFGQRRLAIQSLCPVPAIMHYWKQSAACRTTELDSLFCGPMRRFLRYIQSKFKRTTTLFTANPASIYSHVRECLQSSTCSWIQIFRFSSVLYGISPQRHFEDCEHSALLSHDAKFFQCRHP